MAMTKWTQMTKWIGQIYITVSISPTPSNNPHTPLPLSLQDKYRVELPPMNPRTNHTPPSIEALNTTQDSIANHNEKKVVPTAGGDLV